MQTSKPYKIFGHGRGIDISQASQGRNVQPFVSTKKIEQVAEKPIQAPFDGYTSSSSTNENNLGYSQVNDINLELTRRIVKEQISKYNLGDQSKLKNDIEIMKTEIRSLKQFASQNDQKSKNDQELKKEIFREIDKVIQEYHDQTANKFREVIKKFDESIKLDCSNKYLPLEFVGDVEKGFQGLEDRIQLLESKLDGTKKQRPTDDPVVVAQVFQLKLKKNDRQLQSIKKMIAEIQSSLMICNESMKGLKSREQEDEEKYKKKIEEQKKTAIRQQSEMKVINDGIDQVKKKVLALEGSVQSVQQRLQQLPPAWIERVQSTESKDIKQFFNNSKNLVVSNIFESGVKQIKSFDELKPQQIEDIIHRQSCNSLEELEKKQQSQKQKQKEDFCYRIDKYNFLLDEDGNYILNEMGKQIQLSQEQIVLLRNSTLVKLCQ